MTLDPHVQRALVLAGQGRHELAEQELRRHLATDPGDAFALALLADSLVAQQKFDAAEEAARQAVGRGPDVGFAHYTLARVLSQRNRDDEALVAVAEAVRLDPTNAAFHALRSGIEFDRRRWNEALAAAETGLACDPEHVVCTNLRGMALVKLGRGREADDAIRTALARDPDNALSHANRGWTLLERGDHRAAVGHFRESLRLDPDDAWARSGLVEAIKAGNPLYRLVLNYILWMQKLGPRAQWGVVMGGFLGSRLLARLAAVDPAWGPWVNPTRILYGAFALSTWLAVPIANLLMLFHPVGRHALSATQRRQAGWVGACLAGAVAALATWLVTGRGEPPLLAAVVSGLLALPAAAVFGCQPGWPRQAMAACGMTLAAVGLAAVVLLAVAGGDDTGLGGLATLAFGLFVLGIVASQFLANWLSSRRPVL